MNGKYIARMVIVYNSEEEPERTQNKIFSQILTCQAKPESAISLL